MLPAATSLKADLMNLPPAATPVDGVTNFVGAVSAFVNQVQAGGTGSPGIFTFGDAAMIAIMSTMTPVSDDSWKAKLANAFEAGLLTGICTPGTVANPVWIGSAGFDATTLPTAHAASVSAAKAIFLAGLDAVGPTPDAPLPLANAIRDATLGLIFICVGLSAPPPLAPIPIPIPAQ